MKKMHTRWKRFKNNPLIGERLFCEEFAFYKIQKVMYCKEYCRCAVTPGGSHWFDKDIAWIVTDTGLKYRVPYLWLLLNSVNSKGERLA